jgi:hypothetical protein
MAATGGLRRAADELEAQGKSLDDWVLVGTLRSP